MNRTTALNQAAELLPLSTTPRLDAEVLLSHVLQISRSELLISGRDELATDCWQKFSGLIEQRAAGVPIAYIVGSKEFWGMEFQVTPATLIPRPETEHLVEQALEILKPLSGKILRILELGTGTGCISIALATELSKSGFNFQILAVDISEAALLIAEKNYQQLAAGLPINFQQSNWFQSIPNQQFDLIVTNPPYVNPDLPDLSPELRYEPAGALYSADLGLTDIYEIIKEAVTYLTADSFLLIEMGSEQRELLENYLRLNHPQAKIEFIEDLAGKNRIAKIKFQNR